MALTVAVTETTTFGNKKVKIGTIDFDDSYPTGGEELLPGTLGMERIDFIQINADGDGYLFEYDYSASKVVAYVSGGTAGVVLAEDANQTNMSGVTDVKFMAFGT